jgi:hypothetical protein
MTIVQKIAIGIYIGTFVLCTVIMLAGAFMDPILRESVLPTVVDGFKMVLGALIGAASTLLGAGARQ